MTNCDLFVNSSLCFIYLFIFGHRRWFRNFVVHWTPEIRMNSGISVSPTIVLLFIDLIKYLSNNSTFFLS